MWRVTVQDHAEFPISHSMYTENEDLNSPSGRGTSGVLAYKYCRPLTALKPREDSVVLQGTAQKGYWAENRKHIINFEELI